MPDCERWTLTHSSGWADVLAEPGLALVPALELWLGLAARRASSDAEATGEAEVWDDDAETDGEADDSEGDPDGELDLEAKLVGEGVAEAFVGCAVAAGEVAELETEEDGVGVGVRVGVGVGVGEFDGFGFGFGFGFGVGVGVGVLVGVGVGVGVLAASRTWQSVSVFALALVAVPGLSEAACAGPGRPASTPRDRKPPPSTLSAVTRTCARRMRIALSPLLVGVTVCS